MGLFRLLLLIALIVLVVWLWKRFGQLLKSNPSKPEDSPLPMVRCAHCGVHLPQNQALQAGKHWYCNQDHWAKHQGS